MRRVMVIIIGWVFVAGVAAEEPKTERPLPTRGATSEPESLPSLRQESRLRWSAEPTLQPGLQQPQLPPRDLATDRPRQRFAVCIGINRYLEESGYAPLKYAGADAMAMSQSFLDHGQFDRVLLITDAAVPESLKPATDDGRLKSASDTSAQGIQDEIAKFLPLASGLDDVVVFYFAGHGDSNPAPFLVPGDTRTDRRRKISLSDVFESLTSNDVRARNKLVILDVCRSAPNDAQGRTMSKGFRAALVQPEQRLAVLTGCDADQSCFETDEEQHGRFTWALLDALRGNGFKKGEERLLVSHFYEHVLKVFEERRWGTRQSPQQFLAGTLFALASRSIPKPPPLGELGLGKLREVQAEARKLYRSSHQPGHLEKASEAYRLCLRVLADGKLLKDPEARRVYGELLAERALTAYRLGERKELALLREQARRDAPNALGLRQIEVFEQTDQGDTVAALDRMIALVRSTGEADERLDAYFWSRKAALEESSGDYAAATLSYGKAALASHRAEAKSQSEEFYDQMSSATSRAWLEQSRERNDPSPGLIASAARLNCAEQLFGRDDWRIVVVRSSYDYVSREARLSLAQRQRLAELELVYKRFLESGKYRDALSATEWCIALERNVLGPNHPNYAMGLINRGDCLKALNRFAEAGDSFESALAIFHESYGSNHFYVGVCRQRLGDIEEALGNLAQADEHYQAALKLYERWDRQLNIGFVCRKLGRLSRAAGDQKTADQWTSRGLTALSTSQTPQGYSVRGQLLFDSRQFDAAAASFAQAEDGFERRGLRVDVAWMLLRQGDCHREMGNQEDAVETYQEALRRFRELNHDRGVASTLFWVGLSLKNLKRHDGAVLAFRDAATAYERCNDSTNAASMLSWQGDCHREAANHEAAITAYKECLRQFRELKDDEVISGNASALGKSLKALKRFDEAVLAFREAASAYERRNKSTNAARMLSWQGDCYREAANHEAAATVYKECLRQFRDLKDDEGISDSASALGKSLKALKRFDEAVLAFREAAAAYERRSVSTNVAWMYGWQGDCYRDAGNDQLAAAAYRECIERFQEQEHLEGISVNSLDLGKSLKRLGQFDEAVTAFETAADAYQKQNKPVDSAECILLMVKLDAAPDTSLSLASLQKRVDQVFAKVESPAEIARLRNELAARFLSQKQFAIAGQQYEVAIAAWRTTNDAAKLADALFWRGRCYVFLSQHKESFPWFEESFRLATQEGLAELVGASASSLAERYSTLGDYRRAADTYRIAATALNKSGNRQWSTLCGYGIAFNLRKAAAELSEDDVGRDQLLADSEREFNHFFTAMSKFEEAGDSPIPDEQLQGVLNFPGLNGATEADFNRSREFCWFAFEQRVKRQQFKEAIELADYCATKLFAARGQRAAEAAWYEKVIAAGVRAQFNEEKLLDWRIRRGDAFAAVGLFSESIADYELALETSRQKNRSDTVVELCFVLGVTHWRRNATAETRDQPAAAARPTRAEILPKTRTYLTEALFDSAGSVRGIETLGRLSQRLAKLPELSRDSFEALRDALVVMLNPADRPVAFVFSRLQHDTKHAAVFATSSGQKVPKPDLNLDTSVQQSVRLHKVDEPAEQHLDLQIQFHLFPVRTDGKQWMLYIAKPGGSMDLAMKRILTVTHRSENQEVQKGIFEGYLSTDRKCIVLLATGTDGVTSGRVVQTEPSP